MLFATLVFIRFMFTNHRTTSWTFSSHTRHFSPTFCHHSHAFLLTIVRLATTPTPSHHFLNNLILIPTSISVLRLSMTQKKHFFILLGNYWRAILMQRKRKRKKNALVFYLKTQESKRKFLLQSFFLHPIRLHNRQRGHRIHAHTGPRPDNSTAQAYLP